MRSGVLAFVVVLAVSTGARADDRSQIRGRLIEAVNKRDYRAVESLVAVPLRAEKVRFASEPCRKFWGIAVLVHTTELHAFVDCLASQTITALAGAGATIDAIYGPGFPLVITFDADAKIAAFTSQSAPGSKPLHIEPTTFALHVTTLSRVLEPSKETKRALEASGAKAVQAELSLCVDVGGATVPVATVADPALKTYEQDVAAAAHGWKIEPFRLDGNPALACATYIVGYPATAIDQPLALTKGPLGVEPQALEPLRIRGSKLIVPDDATKKKISETSSQQVIGSFKLCLDPKGVPSNVSVIKPTGYDAYDQKILREMTQWAYKPYVVAGSAVPVCTAVTFIYAVR